MTLFDVQNSPPGKYRKILHSNMYSLGMRLGEGVEWALHCCTVLGAVPPELVVPVSVLAEFHGLRPAYLAKQMQALSRNGIVESVPGRTGGYRLARPTGEITVLDVVLAVEGQESVFKCTEVRQQGPVGADPTNCTKPCGIAATMWRAEEQYRRALAETSIEDLSSELANEVTDEEAEEAWIWFAEQLGLSQATSVPESLVDIKGTP